MEPKLIKDCVQSNWDIRIHALHYEIVWVAIHLNRDILFIEPQHYNIVIVTMGGSKL